MFSLQQCVALRPLLCDEAMSLPEIIGVQCDSRQVKPGDLFVAQPGPKQNGADFIQAARQAGAIAILGETEACDIRVTDARLALGIIDSAFHGDPSHHMAICGITGTNGKTTTAWLLRDMLAQGGLIPGLQTTVMREYPDVSEPSDRTTPGALELQTLFGAMRTAGCRAVSMEVSSHAIDQQRIAGTRFALRAFTNLTQDHLDYHKTMEAYYQVKRSFLAAAGDAPVVINSDDTYGRRLQQELDGRHLVTYSLHDTTADVWAEITQLAFTHTAFTLHFSNGLSYHVISRLVGEYNVSNMLCAAASAYALGVWPEVIVTALTEARPKWGRLEQVAPGVFVDYAHTDDALRHVLTTLRALLNHGRLICVFGCGGDRDRTKRPLMGRAVSETADYAVVTSDNPRTEDPNAIIAEILPAMSCAYEAEPDRLRAIHHALQLKHSEDIVVIAGKGHETYQEIHGIHHPFSDRAVVEEFYATTRTQH